MHDHATMHMKELPMFTYNLWIGCLQPDTMSIILSSYQHCDDQQFQTLSCAFYTIFPVLKLDLVIQALLLDYILALAKYTRTPCVHLYLYRNQYFSTLLRQNIQQKVLVFQLLNLLIYHIFLPWVIIMPTLNLNRFLDQN